MQASRKHRWSCPERPGMGCYGTGYNGWGVQTNQKYLAAMAVLATTDWPGRDEAMTFALAALRFSLASHHTGDCACTDGTQWGRTWISPLGIERMMHGIDRLQPHLQADDRRRLAEILADEAAYQLTCPVQAGLWAQQGSNKPESNIWNGAICVRAAWACPGDPRAAAWREHACRCFINGISIPADATDATMVDGRPVAQWHVGPNFFPHYALDHHGYLNVGYMAICLSNIAMLHYARRPEGSTLPDSLYHHARDLWNMLRRMIFADGRLIRIGGDTRIRFCYCQDYLIPVLAFAADHWNDRHALTLLAGAVDIIRREQGASADGRFLCDRLADLGKSNPYYYTRLESDRACTLSMAIDWLGRRGDESDGTAPASGPARDFESSVTGSWEEIEHGAAFHRGPKRMVSFCWRAAEGPQGLCLPPSDGELAEWQENLGGHVRFVGEQGQRVSRGFSIHSFEGGLLTYGTVTDGARVEMPEGWEGSDSALHYIVMAALPDGQCALRMEYAVSAARRVYVDQAAGVWLSIPNDVFLKRQTRQYQCSSGQIKLPPHLGRREVLRLSSRWVNVDGVLGLIGLYGADGWDIFRPGQRTGGMAMGNILCDVLCWQFRDEPFDVFGPAILLDNACLIVSSADADTTAALARRCQGLPCPPDVPDLRAVIAEGVNGRQYVLAANFGLTPRHFQPPSDRQWRPLGGELRQGQEFKLDPGQAVLLESLDVSG